MLALMPRLAAFAVPTTRDPEHLWMHDAALLERWLAEQEEAIEISVRDNGIGIAPQYHEQIFHIFQRLHTQDEFDGTGIGLAIVRKAAHKLGGSVRLESVPEQGSTFYVRLPR